MSAPPPPSAAPAPAMRASSHSARDEAHAPAAAAIAPSPPQRRRMRDFFRRSVSGRPAMTSSMSRDALSSTAESGALPDAPSTQPEDMAAAGLAYQPRIKPAPAAVAAAEAAATDATEEHGASPPPSSQSVATVGLHARRASAAGLQVQTMHLPEAQPLELAHDVTPTPLPVEQRNARIDASQAPRPAHRGMRQRLADSLGEPSLRPPRTPHPKAGSDSSIAQAAAAGTLPGAPPVVPSFHPAAPAEVRAPLEAQPLTSPLAEVVAGSEQTAPGGATATTIKLQRPQIKVRCITWNHGASVPKGDLEVLLGRVGEYVPPEPGWDVSDDEGEDEEPPAVDADAHKARRSKGKGVAGQERTPRRDRIPPLVADDAHPYHVIVIAGQECPWGDGKRLATGVALAGELGDLARTKTTRKDAEPPKKEGGKDKDKDDKKEKEKSKEESKPGESQPPPVSSFEVRARDHAAAEMGVKSPGAAIAAANEFPFSPTEATRGGGVPQTPGGGTGFPLIGALGMGKEGWSAMCDAWLCKGPIAQLSAVKDARGAVATPLLSEATTPVATPEIGNSPDISRAASPAPGALRLEVPKLKLRTDALLSPTKKGDAAPQTPTSAQVIGPADISPSKRAAMAARRDALAVPKPAPAMRRSVSATRVDQVAESEPSVQAPGEFGQIRKAPPPVSDAEDEAPEIPNHHRHRHLLPYLGHHHDGTPRELGPYELVMKERCYMMYLAVYVFRGALDRVRGSSRGHVKSGLLAGRVGNKGAVGISLKLGMTRLLFVNAHLAAHEGRVAERIANVEKIKKELQVDTFLPEGDARRYYQDVTAAFDHCFWMGDLNFRVDITRRHADWLLMQKRYDQALEFDQLRKVMRETDTFRGFTEAPIKFLPTFKYDVLKTLKSKSGEPRRKLTVRQRVLHRREGSNKAADVVVDEPVVLSTADESAEDTGRRNSAISGSSGSQGHLQIRRDGAPALLQHESDVSSNSSIYESSAFSQLPDSGGSALSLAALRQQSVGTDAELDELLTNTSAAEGPLLSHGTAIKAKQRLKDMVHAVTGHRDEGSSKPPPEPRRSDSKGSSVSSTGPATPLDMPVESRGLGADMPASSSAGSVRTAAQLYEGDMTDPRLSTSSLDEDVYPERFAKSSDTASLAGSIIVSPISTSGSTSDHKRKHSLHRRRKLGRRRSPDAAAAKAGTTNAADDTQVEEQQYDTSAKQRVPSWCDRVLWRSNVISEEPKSRMEPKPSRVGTVLSNVTQQLRSSTFRRDEAAASTATGPTVTFAPAPRVPTRQPSYTTGQPMQSSPLGSPSSETNANEATTPATPAAASRPHRLRWFAGRHSKMQRTRTFDGVDSKVGMTTARDIGMFHRASSAVDLPSHMRSPERGSASLDGISRRPSLPRRRSSLSRRLSQASRSGAERTGSPRSVSASAVPGVASVPGQGSRSSSPAGASSPPRMSFNRASSGGDSPREAPAAAAAHAPAGGVSSLLAGVGSGRRTSWWADRLVAHLPAFLAPSSFSPFSLSPRPQEPAEPVPELVGPKRGEIQCLLYKTLDDREMRLLEGRSDHRPVIWVGTVGI